MAKCEICGKILKNPKSPSHIRSRFHQDALKKLGLNNRREVPPSSGTYKAIKDSSYPSERTMGTHIFSGFIDFVLFQSLAHLSFPNYSKIISFCTSFGLKSEDIFRAIIRKLREGDIEIKGNIDPRLHNIYESFLKASHLSYPISMRIDEAQTLFKMKESLSPIEVIDYFRQLSHDFPGLVDLSSSRRGYPEDLITFKRIFPDSVIFKLNKRWAP